MPARHFTPATVEQRDAERSWPTEPELQSCDTVLAVGAVLEPVAVEAEEGEGEETEGGDEEEKERAAACDAGEGPPEVGATRKRVTEKGGSEPKRQGPPRACHLPTARSLACACATSYSKKTLSLHKPLRAYEYKL